MEQSTEQKSKEGGNSLWYLFSKMWRYSAGNRGKVVCFWTMFIVAESASLILAPLVMARLLNVIQREGITARNIMELFGLLLVTLAVSLFFWGLHGPGRLMERANSFKERVNYRKYLLKGVLTLPLEWHAEHHSGDTIDKVEKGVNALYRFSEDSFDVIYGLVQLVISYGMLAYFSPSAAYIVLAMIFVTAWITTRFDRVLIEQYQELNHAENRIAESILDAVSNIATVVILRVERLVFGAIVRKVESPYELFTRNNRMNELKYFLTNVCCTMTTILVLGVYFYRNIGTAHGVLIGNVYILIQYLDVIGRLFFKFTGMYGDILERKAKVMNAEELAEDFKEESFANHVLPRDWRRLSVENLDFSYDGEGSEELHLENVSLSLAHGERVALVGESGSGKTTLLRVMRDLYHPRSLSLSVDGKTVPQGFEGISRGIALVPQDPEIFATTILENITIGTEYDLDFVRRFTDMACFTDVVEGLPKKWHSSIKEKGVNLSGGQQQRLALARGLLACHDKDIVLLDEPTSSIDTANEMSIYTNIFREFPDKTIVSSIHRLHLLPLFHRIYLFDEGRIVAAGDLNELLLSCPEFRETWRQYHESGQETPS